MERPFLLVDVFGASPYRGNALAVVLDAEGLSSEQMQAVAAWASVAETTFVSEPSAPEADYQVRIFTPTKELPFAGHPTLGTAHAWLRAQGRPLQSLVQECGAGLVRLSEREGMLYFAAPPLVRSGPLDEAERAHLESILNLPPGGARDSQWVDNGPGWAALWLNSAEAVLGVRPGPVDCFVGVAGPCPAGSATSYEVRTFTPGPGGVPVEDPVTGSFNASLAQWLIGTGRAGCSYMVSQGGALGRNGHIYIRADEQGQVWVGGGTSTCVSGTIDI